MDNAAITEIYEEELSDAETDLVVFVDRWLQQRPDAEWKQSRTSKYIDQYLNKSLLDYIWSHYPNERHSIMVLRMRPSEVPTYQSGYLFPLRLCDGSTVVENKISYKLEFGKKLRIPTQPRERYLCVKEGLMYLLWVFVTEADMKPQIRQPIK